VTKVLGEFAARALDGDVAGLDGDLDALRDRQDLFRMDVPSHPR
jgi:hypothetical protein